MTGSFVHRYEEFGGGSLPSFSWRWADAPPYARTGEVETLDGFLLVLSPWAVRNLRFDESLGQLHGYDFDLCLQARAAGRKVVTFDVRAIHHRSLELIADPEQWIEAHIAIANKWNGVIDGVGAGAGTWKDRALRAEAEADAAALHAYAHEMERDARAEQLNREIRLTRESISWRLTDPLRGKRN